MADTTEGALDLARCEAEPIHSIDAVQDPFAMLVVCPTRRVIVSASANLPGLVDRAAETIGGQPLSAVFANPQALPWLDPDHPVARRRTEPSPLALVNGREVLVTAFAAGALQGLVIDPDTGAGRDPGASDTALLMQFNAIIENELERSNPDATQLCDALARAFRTVSGYDHAMVYRFDADLNGTIIAESRDPGIETSYLGLTFPSSDIPRPARELFLRNRARAIVDIDTPPHPMLHFLPETRRGGIDIGECPERAVSPVHVHYLRNMGVRATLTLALVVRGRLWGLLTCHHRAPRKLPAVTLTLCRALCELLSQGFTRFEDIQHHARRARLHALAAQLRATALDGASGETLQQVLGAHETALLEALEVDGLAILTERASAMLGTGLDRSLRSDLMARSAAWCRRWGRDVFATNRLRDHWPEIAARAAPGCAGVLATAPAEGQSRVLVWRQARKTTVTWAGEPAKRVTDNGPLTPRRSFEAWRETQIDRAPPWRETDGDALEGLRALLTEIAWIVERRQSERRVLEAHACAREARRALEHSSLHDALTGLPNRASTLRVLASLRHGRLDRPVAVMVIDIDHFKGFNESYGHDTGDAVLSHAAATIRAEAAEADFLARIGDNAFALVVTEQATRPALAELAGRVLAAVARPVGIAGETLHPGASIGIAMTRAGTIDAAALLARADIALHESKVTGRSRFCFVTDEMESRRTACRRLGEEIMIGLAEGAFEVVYQPQFHAATLEMVGAEALVRWRHPERGMLAPDQFLDAAEEIGALDRIDAFVVAQAMRDLRGWHAARVAVPQVSVNLSARRLRDPDLLGFLREHPVTPGTLTFELLETVNLERLDADARRNLIAIRDAGIGLEIDDFGTGHTSIMNLVQIRPDRLKIDRSLVLPIVQSRAAMQLLGGILDIARALGIAVVAEGVETDDHIRLLRAAGCDRLQGYALSMPVAAHKLEPLDPARRRTLTG